MKFYMCTNLFVSSKNEVEDYAVSQNDYFSLGSFSKEKRKTSFNSTFLCRKSMVFLFLFFDFI